MQVTVSNTNPTFILELSLEEAQALWDNLGRQSYVMAMGNKLNTSEQYELTEEIWDALDKAWRFEDEN